MRFIDFYTYEKFYDNEKDKNHAHADRTVEEKKDDSIIPDLGLFCL